MFAKDIFCERLTQLRKENNLSQQEIADIARVSYHAVSKIENKQRAASIEFMYAIAEHFNISLDWLTGLSSTRERQS